MHIQNNGNYFSNTGVVCGGVNQQQAAPAQQPPVMPVVTDGQAQPALESPKPSTFLYDVALSYAGEQEKLVGDVAKILEAEGLKVFFAPDCSSAFLGENMLSQFYRIYRYESLYVAAFVTKNYVRKEITLHEATTAMLRRKEEGRSCLIPIRFDGAVLPRLDPDLNYLPGDGLLAVELADKIRSVVCAPSRRPT